MNRNAFSILTVLGSLALSGAASDAIAQQRAPLPLKHTAQPTSGAITAPDLMSRLYVFADDSMMGRAAGTADHDKGTAYIARELARLGLKPAGDSGTFFQQIPLIRRTLAAHTTLSVDGRDFMAGRDFIARDNGPTARSLDRSTAIFGGTWGDSATMLSPDLASGKVVVLIVPGVLANRAVVTQRYLGAAGIVVATMDSMPEDLRAQLSEPALSMKGEAGDLPPVPSFLYSSRAMAEALLGAPLPSLTRGASGKTVSGSFGFAETPARGARNVVAILPGSDPALRGQYVAIGAHSDHVGLGEPVDHDSLYAFYHVVRPEGADDGNKPAMPADWPKVRAMLDSLRRAHAPRVDSIYNGADDDGSGSMGVLEIAEAFATAKQTPKRSVLFVWHVAEELGLLGSAYFTDHPTVARDSIVGQINVDMIGRGPKALAPGGRTGDLQIIGSRRLSTELGDIVDAEGKKFTPPFKYDYQYDANGHPGQYYCRSDHYMYARYGIPVAFLSTGGHPEYHEVTDEPQYIDYDGLARVSQLVYNVASRVANLDHRLVVDKPKPDPQGNCVQ